MKGVAGYQRDTKTHNVLPEALQAIPSLKGMRERDQIHRKIKLTSPKSHMKSLHLPVIFKTKLRPTL